MGSDRFAGWVLCILIGSMPLLFGAVHPFVSGMYSAVLLLFCGGWLLNGHFSSTTVLSAHASLLLLRTTPIFLILYIVLQTLPLPVPMVEFLSPVRAERMEMVANLGGVSFSTLPLTERNCFGFYQALSLVALFFYYCMLRCLFERSSDLYRSVLYTIVLLGTFEAFYGLLQFVKPNLGTLWLPSYGRGAHGTIIYKNQFASLMNMIWPLTFAFGSLLFWRGSRKPRKSAKDGAKTLFRRLSGVRLQAPLFVFLSGFMVLSVVFSLSRGGILSFLFTAFLFLLFLPFSARIKGLVFLCFTAIIVSYGMLLGWETVVERFDTVDRSALSRIAIYESSLQMVADHWLTGVGMGGYELLSSAYVKWAPERLVVDRVHCEYLELLIELGVPVASILFLWICVGMVFIFKAVQKKDPDSPARLIGIAAWCGLVSFLIHGAIDFGWRLPANLFYAVTLLALATGSETMDRVVWKMEHRHQKRKP